jgi:uncharacterized protein with HEPN domain
MENRDFIRFKHMLDSANAILNFTNGKTRKSLSTDRMFSNAVIREFEVLGEAANNISKKTQKLFPHLPWKQIISMRNTLIHAYFDVDYDIIWETVINDLPLFYLQLQQIVSDFTK